MAQELHFHALERRRSGAVTWLSILVVVTGVLAAVAWGLTRVSAWDESARALAAAQAQLQEFRGALAERDRLLKAAHDEIDLLESPGQAMGIFYRAAPEATESGVVMAAPAQGAARFYLYGLVAPAASGEYAAVARMADGTRKVLGRVLPNDLGEAFLVSRNVPGGTAALELALLPSGHDRVEQGDVRISARYPTRSDERGVLVQESAQARTVKKR
jgi:hypothetical protein